LHSHCFIFCLNRLAIRTKNELFEHKLNHLKTDTYLISDPKLFAYGKCNILTYPICRALKQGEMCGTKKFAEGEIINYI
jgi:hypothetical protein